MAKDKDADHFRQDKVATTPDRQGLKGAAPVGNRWRAQGNLGGSVRYLGTFDTEEEAHEVYVAAKKAHDEAKAEDEAEWLANAPVYLYDGGIGRGARLNGTRYKLVSDELNEHMILRQIGHDGTIASDTVTLNRRYLRLVEGVGMWTETPDDPDGNDEMESPGGPSPGVYVAGGDSQNVPPGKASGGGAYVEVSDRDLDDVERALRTIEGISSGDRLANLPPEVAAAILKAKEHLVEGTRDVRMARREMESLREHVVALVFVQRRTNDEQAKALEWLLQHVTKDGGIHTALQLIQAKTDHQTALAWLREHTDIPHELLDSVEKEMIEGLFFREGDPLASSRYEEVFGSRNNGLPFHR